MDGNFVGVRVLFIDDSAAIRRTADTLLSKKGFEVITATDGFDGLSKIIAKRPSIIFIDSVMPGLDGYQTCALIKNNDELRNIPVILLSKQTGPFERAKGRIAGADKFLTKPFSKDELYDAIQHQLILKLVQLMLRPITFSSPEGFFRRYSQADREVKLRKLKQIYYHALTRLLKNGEKLESLATFSKSFKIMSKLCGNSPMGYLSVFALGIIEFIAKGSIRLDKDAVRILLSIGSEITRLAEMGSKGLKDPIDRTLVFGLVQLVEDNFKNTKGTSLAKKNYSDQSIPALNAAAVSDPEAIKTFASMLISDLVVVMDKLDFSIRSSRNNAADLVALIPDLETLSKTIFLLADIELQKLMSKLLEIVLKIQKSDEPYEQVVIKIGHLLSKIKRSLELLVVKNSSKKDIFSSLDDDQVALIRNSQARIVACKQALLAYIEAKFDHHQLVSLPDDLAQLTSNLINLKQTRLGNLLAVLDRYVRSQLFADTSEIKASRMEDFADILSSVDLFLVKLLNDGDCSSKLLELGESAAGELRYRIGFQNVDSAEIEIHAEQILGRVEELNSRSRTSKSLDNFNKERLYRDDYFIIEEADLLEEIELHEAITQGDKAIAKLERLIPPFNKRNRPNFDE